MIISRLLRCVSDLVGSLLVRGSLHISDLSKQSIQISIVSLWPRLTD